MASNIFIKFDGIPGEARGKDHKDEIDVLSWSWGVAQSGSMGTGGGGGRGKASVHDLNFTKEIDKASPKLFEACCNGKHIASITLSANKAGEKPMEFLKVSLADCIISSIQTNGSESGYVENVSLNFGKVEIEYTEQDEKGSPKGKVGMKFNVKENA